MSESKKKLKTIKTRTIEPGESQNLADAAEIEANRLIAEICTDQDIRRTFLLEKAKAAGLGKPLETRIEMPTSRNNKPKMDKAKRMKISTRASIAEHSASTSNCSKREQLKRKKITIFSSNDDLWDQE